MNIKTILKYTPQKEYDFNIQSTTNASVQKLKKQKIEEKVSSSLDKNLKFLQYKYNTLINSDIIIRNFSIVCKNIEYKSFLIYIDGMSDSNLVNHYVLNPLMLRNMNNTFDDFTHIKTSSEKLTVVKLSKTSSGNSNLSNYIYERLVPQNNISKQKDFQKIISDINSGNCLLFVDTIDIAFNIDVKGFKQRNIDKPRYRKCNKRSSGSIC